MLLVVCPRIHLSILQHGLESIVVINPHSRLLTPHSSSNTFHKGISNHDLSIRTALGPAVAVATAGIGHIALALVDIQQRVHDLCLSLFIEQGDEGRAGAIGVPDGIVVVIVRCFSPFGILATFVHRHNQRVIKGCVEHPLVSLCAFNLELAELLLPSLTHLIQLGAKVAVWDIPLGLLGADIGDTNLYI